MNQWFFDSEDRKLERNCALWHRLFLSSKNESFDMDTLWKSYAIKLKNLPGEINENVMAIVDFSAPNVMTVNDDERGQVLNALTRKNVQTESTKSNIEWTAN